MSKPSALHNNSNDIGDNYNDDNSSSSSNNNSNSNNSGTEPASSHKRRATSSPKPLPPKQLVKLEEGNTREDDLKKEPLSNAAQVAQHYNTRRVLGVEGRLHTRITGLRLFNNWVKSVLISQYAYPGCRVLDLGCGKGGDLKKWVIAAIGEYVGMDIAQVSVSHAHQRFLALRSPSFEARFYAQDCYGDPLENTLQPPDYQADIISAQFCLHYAFESESKVRQMLHNVSSHLRTGGTFVITIPNANWLMWMMKNKKSTTFGNSVYTVKFEREEPVTLYGFPYAFTLDEAVEDCTEYLVHLPSFVELAETFDLVLVYSKGFHDFYYEKLMDRKYVELFHRMRVVDEERPSISDDEWEAIGIYLTVVFRKKMK
ncbi:mRNA cap guanine-N7 methyltransferase [Coemansia erecta]|nr:mRNA cap guanine-N7 methyltransferase [Coemansia erecta]